MKNCRHNAIAFVVLVFISLLSTGAHSQDLPDWVRNRIFWVSSDAPIAKALNDDNAITSSTQLILDHVTHVEKAVLNETVSRQPRDPNNPLRPCNANILGWINSVTVHHLYRGWPAPDTSCITDLLGTQTSAGKPKYTLDQVYDAVNARAEALKKRAKSVPGRVLRNWTKPDAIHNAPFNRLSQRCVVDAVGIVRVKDLWYMITSFTNAPVDQQLFDWKRQTLAEYLRVGSDGKFAGPLLMTIPERPEEEGVNATMVKDTTTYLGSWAGNSNPSNFISTFPDENPAVLDALDASDLDVQQVEDAQTPSGIAILVLPLVLNLVPISLLAQVSTCTMLIYLLMSDILTVIPLCIKGVELIIIGKKRTRSVVMRLTSALDGSVSESSVGELWASECRAQDNVLSTGIVFVVLALTFLVVGIVSELAAKHFVTKRRRRRMQRLQEQTGPTSSHYSSGSNSRTSHASRSRRPRASGSDRLSGERDDILPENDRNA